MSNKIIYRLDDEISFRKCSLFDEYNTDHGDCTNFHTKEVNFHDHYFCNQEGIHNILRLNWNMTIASIVLF